MYSTEYAMTKYPVVPAGVIYSIVDAFVGQKSLASIGKNFGIQHVVRWKMSSQKLEKPLPLPPVVYSWIVQAMIGALFTEQGPKAVKQVMQKHIFSRAIDADEHINMHIKLNKPRKLLLDIFKTLNKPKPTAR
jgi:dsRNA-specific ribonuclease